MAEEEDGIGHPLNSMHPAHAARTECGVGEEAGEEEEQGVSGEEIVRNRVRFAESYHYPDEPNHRKANTDHGGRHREDMNTNIFLEVSALFVIGLHLPANPCSGGPSP